MKKSLVLFLICLPFLFFTGCFEAPETDNETPSPEDAFYQTYQTNEFSIQIPDSFETVTSFTSAYPQNTVVAFRNNLKEKEFIANVNIVKNTLEEEISALDYGQELLEAHRNTLLNFKKISQEKVSVPVEGEEKDTYLNTFQGKNLPESDLLTFKQIYAVKGKTAFIVTATYGPDEDELTIEKCEKILRSFKVK